MQGGAVSLSLSPFYQVLLPWKSWGGGVEAG